MAHIANSNNTGELGNSTHPNETRRLEEENGDGLSILDNPTNRHDAGLNDADARRLNFAGVTATAVAVDDASSSNTDDHISHFPKHAIADGNNEFLADDRGNANEKSTVEQFGSRTRRWRDDMRMLKNILPSNFASLNSGGGDVMDDSENVVRMKRVLNDWSQNLTNSMLDELESCRKTCSEKMLFQHLKMKKQYEAEIGELRQQLNEQQALGRARKQQLAQKMTIIVNLTDRVGKLRDDVEKAKTFGSWKNELESKRREAFIEAIATKYANLMLKRKYFKAWQYSSQMRWRQHVQAAAQRKAETLIRDMDQQYQERIATLQQTIDAMQRENMMLKGDKTRLKDDTRKAFMRGVCALNFEALGLLKTGASDRVDPAAYNSAVDAALDGIDLHVAANQNVMPSRPSLGVPPLHSSLSRVSATDALRHQSAALWNNINEIVEPESARQPRAFHDAALRQTAPHAAVSSGGKPAQRGILLNRRSDHNVTQSPRTASAGLVAHASSKKDFVIVQRHGHPSRFGENKNFPRAERNG